MTMERIDADGARNQGPAAESLVSVAAGKAVADSRRVAEKFGKDHKNVLQAIDELRERLLRLDVPMAEISAMEFAEKSQPHPTVSGRNIRWFEISRDAFVLLAMGFAGEEALRWKVEYIRAFNAMEAQLQTDDSSARLNGQAEEASPELRQHALRRLHKIYAEGFIDPDDLLLTLFAGKIPYTEDRKYRFYLQECCDAVGILETDPVFDRIPQTEITTLFTNTPHGQKARRAITESALYFLAFQPSSSVELAFGHSILAADALSQNLRKGAFYLETSPLFAALEQTLRTAAELARSHLKLATIRQ